MSDQGVRLSSSRSGHLVSSGQLVWVDYARPPTLEGHISFVRTPIWVFLDSMESPLRNEYIHNHEGDIKCQTKVLDQARPGQVSSGQLVWVDYARPPTSEGHISFVRTPIWVLLNSMERSLSQEYIHILN